MCGHTSVAGPLLVSALASRVGAPPAALTRQSAPRFTKTMTSPSPHEYEATESATVTAGPPVIGIFLRTRFCVYASQRPSGENRTCEARSVPGMGLVPRSFKLRTYNWAVAAPPR